MSLQRTDVTPLPPRWAETLVGSVPLLTLLYAVLIEGAVLLWFLLALGAGVVYPAYRFVLAVERLVRATERVADSRERR